MNSEFLNPFAEEFLFIEDEPKKGTDERGKYEEFSGWDRQGSFHTVRLYEKNMILVTSKGIFEIKGFEIKYPPMGQLRIHWWRRVAA